MKSKIKLFTIFIALLLTGSAFGAENINTPTYNGSSPTIKEYKNYEGKLLRWIHWEWSVDDASTEVFGGYVFHQTGVIRSCRAIPVTANANYDIAIPRGLDGTGFDVLNDYGQNMSQYDSSPENAFTPLNDQGDRMVLLDDIISFSGTNLTTTADASGEFDMLIEVWDPAK